MTDPFVGQLIFFRVYSGDTVFNPVKDKKERLGRILQMHANERKEIKEVRAGDIAAAVGLKEVMRKARPVLLELTMAVEVETPKEFMGNVMGDLSSRRGIVQGMENIGGGGRSCVRKCRWRRCSATTRPFVR